MKNTMQLKVIIKKDKYATDIAFEDACDAVVQLMNNLMDI